MLFLAPVLQKHSFKIYLLFPLTNLTLYCCFYSPKRSQGWDGEAHSFGIKKMVVRPILVESTGQRGP